MSACIDSYNEYIYKEHPQEAITDLDLWQAAWNACLNEMIKQQGDKQYGSIPTLSTNRR